MIKICFIIIAFLSGLYFCTKRKNLIEGFNSNLSNCPNLLFQEGKELVLLNTKKAKIPGVNPIHFDNLEEYVEYLEWQRNAGFFCPVLYLKQAYDTQNNKGFRILPDPFHPNGGLPSKIPPHLFENISGQGIGCSKLNDANKNNNKKFNKNNYPGYDPLNQYIGEWTCLDELKPRNTLKSPNNQQEYHDKHEFIKETVSNHYNKPSFIADVDKKQKDNNKKLNKGIENFYSR